MVSDDERIAKHILDEVGLMIRDIPVDSTPPEMAELIHTTIRTVSGSDDPYRAIKQTCTEQALALYPTLKKIVRQSDDSLYTALKIAVAGNIIDYGFHSEFDMEQEVENVLSTDFAVDDYDLLKDRISQSDRILYIGDNAGETVFDRVLIEEINKKVAYAVRGKAVLNDVTMEDAVQAGLEDVADLVSSGTGAPGAVLKTCSEAFRKTFESARCIISKGQGNYEALSGVPQPVFFLLKAKCDVIANDIGVERGAIVLKAINVE